MPAYAVEKIVDEAGETVYTAAPEKKRVISEETAWILNRMLRGVVETGTGTAANIPGLDVVGKTGTSDNYADNWFVGVTPVNTVAVWHGGSSENQAAALFASYVEKAGLYTEETFAPCETVAQRIYCPESGLLVSPGCPGIAMGYYRASDEIPQCGLHP